ncbi:hypothetical protein Poli38472_001259 [Pythium oligandrum]|uniref:Uncharacterized protein n=1 Tax=Pythium oligandrum TaxID=41045 RepID=A0A8K1FT10_PYTOL|nr:hypothetical protein Poli38472_001259 [Pythium oligandrum]|eukprot:TMW69103.1 hypothetical protein Poli38472_001259 [Pythium oligandrum]
MRLSEDEAWAIAMMWQEPLRGRVRLATDKSDSMRLVKSYEWIRFDASSVTTEQSAQAFGATARYAAITWLALSYVPGFSCAENPVFWRRVFDTLQWQEDASQLQHRSECFMDKRTISAVTDAIRFFPDENKPFPRFQLALPDRPGDSDVVTFCRAFCGALDHHDEVSDASFQATLARLLPLINLKGANRVVDVGFLLRGLSPNTLSADLNTLVESCSANLETRSTVFQAGVRPQFSVRYVAFRGYLNIFESSHATDLLPLISNAAVEIDQIYFSVYDAVTRHAFASFVNCVFQVDEQAHAHVRRLSFPMNYIAEDKFDAICSALPHARSVRTLRLDRRSCSSRTIQSRDVAWLAYAIFHPDAAESSWKALDLEMVNVSPEYAAVFRTMSRGNNLLAFLDDTPPTSQAYHSARVTEGTIVYSEPRLGEIVLTLDDTSTRFDVCVDSDDVTAMDEWTLTALRISTTRRTNFSSSREALLSILKRLPSLQYLHWDGPSAQFRRREANPIPYVQARKESWERMDISSTSRLAIARGNFGLKHLIALLSVIKKKEAEDSPLAFLNQDLVNEIATYAAIARPRDLSVES